MILSKQKREDKFRKSDFLKLNLVFPAILENDRIWMTITPNEIETMKEAVDGAFGHVLTFGLGLGYYAYMVSEKDNVESITIVEINEDVIHLFNKYVLPQFKNARKIKIIKADAFEYAQKTYSRENMILCLRIYGMMFLME